MEISVWGYQQNFGHRVEYITQRKETTFKDLSNVNRKKVTYETSRKNQLSGYIYKGKNQKASKAMVVFVHAFGGTHQWDPI